jgi:hypothetical protein
MAQSLMAATEQILMLLGLLIGVIFSEAVLQKVERGSTAISFPSLTKKDIIVYFIIAVIITPIVYDRTLNLDPTLPFIIRLGLYIQSGISYPILFKTFSSLK